MGSSKSVTIGYKYYMDIQMGLCRGPIDEIVAIEVGGERAWTGSFTALTGTININKPDLFGGEKKEGGIDGTLQVFMGAREQVYPSSIKSMLGGLVPSFRNVCTTYFSGLISAMNPYPKPWRYRLRRSLRGWESGTAWYSSRARIDTTADDGSLVRAANPAHMIYEALTNSAWGRGLDATLIDDAAFRRAADTLYSEGFGLCLLWSRQDTVDAFIQTVLDHIGAVFYTHPRTGLLVLRLLRSDYDASSLPLLDYSNGILAIEDMAVGSNHTAVNSVSVRFTDPVTGDQKSSPPVRSLAGIQAARSVNEQNADYFALPNSALAIRVATRDLQANMGFLRRFTIHMDRRGWDIVPGDVRRVNLPEYGISDLVVRVGQVTHSDLPNARVSISVIQDVFGMPFSVFAAPQPPGWVAPDFTARAANLRRVREQSYRDLWRRIDPANLALVESFESFVGLIAAPPVGIPLSFDMWSRTGSANFQVRDTAGFAPTAVLASDMPMAAAQITANLVSSVNLNQVLVGQVALIDNEEFIVVAVNSAADTVTLARGTIDTVPAAHSAGARVWFYEDVAAEDETSYLAGAVVQTRTQTRTSKDLLSFAGSPQDSITTVGRQGRPYPPGDVRLNGDALGLMQPFARPGTVTWAHRNREVQQDQLFPHTQASFAKPAGVTYTIRILSPAGTVIRTVTGLVGTSWTYTAEMIGEDNIDELYGGNFRFQLFAVEGTLESWQRYDIPMLVIRPGLGYSLGYYLGGE